MITKISTEKPPFYEIATKFGANWDKGTVFAYGDTLHCKYPEYITADLKIHENVHSIQQEIIGKDVWWDRYFKDDEFRKEQEIMAYRAQYQYALKHYNSRYRKSLVKHMIESMSLLSGGTINLLEAEHLIKDEYVNENI